MNNDLTLNVVCTGKPVSNQMSQDDNVKTPWGSVQNLHQSTRHAVSLLVVDPGQKMDLQIRDDRNEQYSVLSGQATIEIDDQSHILNVSDAIVLPRAKKRSLANNTPEPLLVLEIQYDSSVLEQDLAEIASPYTSGNGVVAHPAKELSPPVCISEIGCNHKGEMSTALEMIKMAAQFCNVDVIKFQKRTNRELLTPEEYDSPHPNPINSYGDSYGEHREHLEFDIAQHRILKEACEDWGCVYSSSVWDTVSAREIVDLDPQLIKVPSAINTVEPVMDILFQEYGGEVHISLGMTNHEEEEKIIEHANRAGRLADLVLYHCISGYPVKNEHLYLLNIERLIKLYGNDVKAIGFSGHHKGIAPDIAALTLGATYFERHFTLDRTWRGTDHAASLEPDGMRRLTRDLKSVKLALVPKPDEIVEVELDQRKKLKKYASR
jgi:sialic acid synthase